MVEMSVRLIGSPVVQIDGDWVQFKTRKALALLCYLALEGAQPQDTLLELLWPDAPHSGSLRTAALHLRQALGSQAWRLQTQWCGLSFERSGVRIDALEIAEWSAETALTSGHGEFLSGLYLRGNVAWDDYLMLRGEELRLEYDARLRDLSQAALRLGDLDQASRLAARRCQLDPLSEEACAQLVDIFGRAGLLRRAQAVQASFRQRFEREFGALLPSLGPLVWPGSGPSQLELA